MDGLTVGGMNTNGATGEFWGNINERCRTCLANGAEFDPISYCVDVGEGTLSLAELILMCATVQISKKDGFPQRICQRCKDAAIDSHNFMLQCISSNKYWRSIIKRKKKLNASRFSNKVPTSDFGDEGTIKDEVEIVEMSLEEEAPDTGTQVEVIKDENHQEEQVAPAPTSPRTTTDVKTRTCPRCDKVFHFRPSMLRHLKRHNAPPPTCRFCPFQTTTPAALSAHMEDLHAHLKTFKCPDCDKSFFRKRNLGVHSITHTGERRHTCEVCGLSFALRGNLNTHRFVHTGEKPHVCGVCGRGFAQSSSLRYHESTHSDARDFVCQVCGAKFSRIGILRLHQKRHSESKPHECSVCGKQFVTRGELNKHTIVHSGAKNYTCEVCGRRFGRNRYLVVHRMIHTGKRPHVCGVCGKGFIQPQSLKAHMRHHENE